MACGHSNYFLFTDDQTEVSDTLETIRKDRKRAQIRRLRWGKILSDELGRLRTEKLVFGKNYSFEKQVYEAKLKNIIDSSTRTKNRTFCLDKNGDHSETTVYDGKTRHWWETGGTKLDVRLKRRKLKWSINGPPPQVKSRTFGREQLP